MKVTPDNEVPIIPKATTNHGAFLLARKKALLSDRFPVIQEMKRSMAKYDKTNIRISVGDILLIHKVV